MQRVGKCGIVILALVIVSVLFLGIAQSASAKEAVKAAYGWSVKDDVVEAVGEAVASMQRGLEGETPEWVLIYNTVGYDSGALLTHVRNLLGPNVKIFGETSTSGVVSTAGFHKGKVGSLALLGVASPRMAFGVGAGDLNTLSPREAGKEAILAAIENAGKGRGERPQMILMFSPCGAEEQILLGIEEITGKKVPIFGGATADDTLEGRWKLYANAQVLSNAVIVTAIYSDLKMGWVMQHGLEEAADVGRGIVTRADGFKLYEIDNRPAGEVYNEWVGGALSKELATGSQNTCNAFTCTNSLAKVVYDKKGRVVDHLVKLTVAFNLPEKSITSFAHVAKGDELILVRGTGKMMLRRPKTNATLARARGRIPKEEVAFAINGQCICTVLTVPEKEMYEMAPMVNEVLGDVPWIGAFTLGEQGYLTAGDMGNTHVNDLSWMVVFGKK